jgi:hypothetical protein
MFFFIFFSPSLFYLVLVHVIDFEYMHIINCQLSTLTLLFDLQYTVCARNLN